MVEREVLKDINSYKTKFIGPFTFRQFVCTVLGSIVAITLFFLLRIVFIDKFCVLLAGICSIPFFVCGYWAPYNIPFEKFVVQYIKMSILTPKNRKYKTDNSYDFIREPKRAYTDKDLKKLKKERQQEIKEMTDIDMIPIK